MKLQNIFKIQKLYYLFFIRQVLSVGILKEKLFRIIVICIISILFAYSLWFNYNLFDGTLVLPEIDWVNTLIRGRMTTDVTWTVIAFVLIKLLFLKKGSFLKMTTQLPITNQERNLSLLLFEILMVLSVVSFMSLSFAIAFSMRFEFVDVLVLLSNELFTILSVYLALQLGYTLVSYFKSCLFEGKLGTIIVYLFTVSMGILMQISLTNFYIRPIETGGLPYEGFHWSILFVWLNDEVHFIIPTITFIILSSVQIFLILKIPNEVFVETQNYMNVPIKLTKKMMLLNVYFLQIMRRIENIITVIISYALFIFLSVSPTTNGMVNPFNAIILLGTLGVYTYMQTDNIRMIFYQFKYNVWMDYGALLSSQLLYLLCISTPLFVLHFMLSSQSSMFSVSSYLDVIVTVLMTILTATYGGIIFPTKKENPFSAFMGMVLTATVVLFIIYIDGFLRLSHMQTLLVRCLFIIFIVLVSVIGLFKLKEEVQHEKY